MTLTQSRLRYDLHSQTHSRSAEEIHSFDAAWCEHGLVLLYCIELRYHLHRVVLIKAVCHRERKRQALMKWTYVIHIGNVIM